MKQKSSYTSQEKTPEGRLVAVSRIFARARKEMSLYEQKAFICALSRIKFTQTASSGIVYIDKKELAGICGVHSNPDHLSVHLYEKLKDLPVHSYIRIADKDRDFYDSGMVITRITMLKNRVRIKFEEEYLPLFTNLTSDYITMWSADIFSMKTVRSVQFYEFLRQNTDTRLNVNEIEVGTKFLKDMFKIPKEGPGSYVSKDGHFLRTSFEKYVIMPFCSDLVKTKMICLVRQPDGMPYRKIKRGKSVTGYQFYWTFTSHPAVTSSEETAYIQERVDKNPAVLKVAKDILKGDTKRTGGSTKSSNPFNNFEQNTYDYSLLEKELTENH